MANQKTPQDRICVRVKNVYGIDKFYPACESSQIFATIAGTKTITDSDIKRIQQLGFRIQEAPTVELSNLLNRIDE